MRNKVKQVIIGITMLVIYCVCLINQDIVYKAVLEGMKRCVYTIIPSLFANTVITSLLAKFGIIRYILSWLPIRAEIIELVILGNVGGYPVGANLLTESVQRNEITKEEAEKLLPCCFSSGPAFCIGVIGYGVFKNTLAGVAVYIVCISVNCILFMILCRKMCKGKKHYTFAKVGTDDIIASVNSSALSMLSITAIICIYSVIIALFIKYLESVKLGYFTSLLDISNIINEKAVPFYAVCGLVSFGGLCVQTQISAIISNHYKIKLFMYTQTLRAVMSIIIGLILQCLIKNISVEAVSVHYTRSDSLIPILCMLCMIYLSLSKRKSRLK